MLPSVPTLKFNHYTRWLSYRNFSIMEYYRSIRPVPLDSDVSKNSSSNDILITDRYKSTRPYYGPQIPTRHPVPTSASTVQWANPIQPPNPKTIKVALLGLPNAGKSSLLNSLLNYTIAAVSPKVNTTREDIKGILTIDDCQIIFIDSPGIVASHHRKKFCGDLVKTAWHSYGEADLCLFIVDVVKRPNRDLYGILRTLSGKLPLNTESDIGLPSQIHDCGSEHQTGVMGTSPLATKSIPVALVLNKIDLASHRKWVKSRMRELNLHGSFSNIFFTSAKNGIGLNPILNYLKQNSKPGLWIYPQDMITTQSKVQIVEQLIRTYIFCWFNKDVPYRVEQKTIGWTYACNGTLNIETELYVKSSKVAKMICGIRGRILKQLQKNVSYKLSKLWNETVFLFIHIKVKNKV